LENFQESGQEYQTEIFQCQNIRKEERSLRAHELGQEKKAASHQSNQTQWSPMP